jgi:hypothetical protein
MSPALFPRFSVETQHGELLGSGRTIDHATATATPPGALGSLG